jgi:hypothetical protein
MADLIDFNNPRAINALGGPNPDTPRPLWVCPQCGNARPELVTTDGSQTLFRCPRCRYLGSRLRSAERR